MPGKGLTALQVWTQIPLASRTVTLGGGGGVTVDTNNDKTGYSLTAGSYSVRASSFQHVSGSKASNTSNVNVSISSVTTTRALEANNGNSTDTAGGHMLGLEGYLSSSTVFTWVERNTGAGVIVHVRGAVGEWF